MRAARPEGIETARRGGSISSNVILSQESRTNQHSILVDSSWLLRNTPERSMINRVLFTSAFIGGILAVAAADDLAVPTIKAASRTDKNSQIAHEQLLAKA